MVEEEAQTEEENKSETGTVDPDRGK